MSDTRTSAGYSDIDRWRLAVYLSKRGVQAWLLDRHSNEVDMLVDVSKNGGEDEEILRRIENAVYDNPTILDDFETDIVIETSRVMAIPDFLADDDVSVSSMINEIYPCDADDIYAENVNRGVAMVYAPLKGLKSFLMRTFPGSRISCHLSVLLRRWFATEAGKNRVCANIRRGQLDFAVIDDKDRLLLTGVNPWAKHTDITYHIANAAAAAGVDLKKTSVVLSGTANSVNSVSGDIGAFCAKAVHAPFAVLASESGLPLPMTLCFKQTN